MRTYGKRSAAATQARQVVDNCGNIPTCFSVAGNAECASCRAANSAASAS
jgi:hypothetical protein